MRPVRRLSRAPLLRLALGAVLVGVLVAVSPLAEPTLAEPVGRSTASQPARAAIGEPSVLQAPPAPDLYVYGLFVQAESGEFYCQPGMNRVGAHIANPGTANAGVFTVQLNVDPTPAMIEGHLVYLPGPVQSTTTVGGVSASSDKQSYFDALEFSEGPHTLQVIADPDNEVHESLLTRGNNTRVLDIVCSVTPGPTVTPLRPSGQPQLGESQVGESQAGQPQLGGQAVVADKPADKPASMLADVRVGKVEVEDKDGRKGCIEGRNSVTVTVKNVGDAESGSFDVRLKVDGKNRDSLTVKTLAAHAEKQAVFSDVRLDRGKHTVQVVVEPDAQSDDDDDKNSSASDEPTCARDRG